MKNNFYRLAEKTNWETAIVYFYLVIPNAKDGRFKLSREEANTALIHFGRGRTNVALERLEDLGLIKRIEQDSTAKRVWTIC